MNNCKILIIGATSKVATQVAKRLARSNRVFLLARDPKKIANVARAVNQPQAWQRCVDFTDIAQTSKVIQQAWDDADGLDIVFIAHGLLGEQIPTEHEYAKAHAIIETNFTSVVAQLITISNLMERQGYGKIAVITSVAGDRGRPRNYTYGAAKGALSIYLQGLRSRLWKSEVEIYNFKMGPVDTPMTMNHKKDFSFSTAEKVAQHMVKALGGTRYTVYVPSFWWFVMWVVRWLPEVIFQHLKFLSGR